MREAGIREQGTGGSESNLRAQMNQPLLIFVALPVVYSVGFFGWCYLAEKKPIFSNRNSRSMLSVICGHITVLLILVMLAQISNRFYPLLPGWFTDRVLPGRGSKASCFEVLQVVSIMVTGAAEKRWIYIDRGVDESKSSVDLS